MTLFLILGASFILIIGGRSEACGALDDCLLLNIEDYSLEKVNCTVLFTTSTQSQYSNQCMITLYRPCIQV